MSVVDVVAPQLGEGLQEVRILRLMKAVGERVERDEDLYEMETDKAEVLVESAYAGVLREWLVAEGDVVPIGDPVARIEVAGDAPEVPEPEAAAPEESAPAVAAEAAAPKPAAADHRSSEGPKIPPRTRAHARRLGVSPEVLPTIPAPSGKLMPADVDAYLEQRQEAPAETPVGGTPAGGTPAGGTPAGYTDRPLSPQQRALARRLQRGHDRVVPATIKRPIAAKAVRRGVARLSAAAEGASELETFAYAVSRIAPRHPRLRSRLLDDDTVREADHLHLGIAVERPGDELVTAVVPRADELDRDDFLATLRRRVARAIDGDDQATEGPGVILTHMGELGIVDAVPALVAPAAAILFVGAVVGGAEAGWVNLVLTFDHRLVNGAGGARFLQSLAEELEGAAATGAEAAGGGVTDSAATGAATGAARKASAAARARKLDALLREHAGAVLDLDPKRIDPRRPLRAQGMGSRQAVQLTGRLASALELELPTSVVWNYPTLVDLADHLAGLLDGTAEGSGGEDAGGSATTNDDARDDKTAGDDLDDLSRDQLEELLERELSGSVAGSGGGR